MYDAKEMTWPYIAGFFDGEGSISFRFSNSRGHRCLNVCARIGQNVEHSFVLDEIIEFLQSKGVSHVTDSITTNNGFSNKQFRVIAISGRENVRIFLKGIVPYLIVKAPKAYRVLSFLEEERQIRNRRGIDAARNFIQVEGERMMEGLESLLREASNAPAE